MTVRVSSHLSSSRKKLKRKLRKGLKKSKNVQKKMINELKNTKIIIEGGKKNNWDVPLEKKLFLIYDELYKNFTVTQKISDWKVFLR